MSSVTQPNFDRVAHIYRWAEYLALGPALQRTRTHFLSALCDRRHALVLGDGDGRFLAALMRENTLINVTAVDTSRRMLTLLLRRCSTWCGRLCTMQASALDVIPDSKTDLIVSHFFLDCLTQRNVDDLVSCVSSVCKPGTRWLISDFQAPEGALLRHFGKAYIWLLYAAFRVLTGLRVQRLPSTREVLSAANFLPIAYHQSLGGLLYAEIWELREVQRPASAQPGTLAKHPLDKSRRKVPSIAA